MYIMADAHRPANLPVPYEDRLNRWCLDLINEDFFIYSVPGEMNLFNDFHTRGGAPGAEHFLTLAEHAASVDAKLAQLSDSASDDADPQEEATAGSAHARVKQHLVIATPAEPPASKLQHCFSHTPRERVKLLW